MLKISEKKNVRKNQIEDIGQKWGINEANILRIMTRGMQSTVE